MIVEIKRDRSRPKAGGRKSGNRCAGAVGIAGAHDDEDTRLRELAGDLKSDALVCAGNERDAGSVGHVCPHGFRSGEASRYEELFGLRIRLCDRVGQPT